MSINPDLLRHKAFIDGDWIDAKEGRTFGVSNPADGKFLGSVPDMTEKDCIAAVDAAEAAFQTWKSVLPLERSNILREWANQIDAYAHDLAFLLTSEQGKPLAEAKGEVASSAATLRWCAEEGRRMYGEFIEGAKAGTKIVISRHPVGVAGAITPWNFPSSMVTRKVGPAIAAGCTVVLKPSEETPLTALALAALAQKAGLPKGVFNVVTTKNAKDVGRVLTDDPRVHKISFTGSTATGKILMGQSAKNVQKISLELGGNAPFIVFPSANLEKAADGAIASKFRNAGQTCICANRIYVHKDIFNQYLEIFSHKVRGLKAGNGADPSVTVGPLISAKAIEKVERLVADAKKAGAKVILGGQRHALGGGFFEPTIMTAAPDDSCIAKEEIFGPVAVLYPFEDENDVIRRANNTPFGLSAYLYSQDMAQIWRVSDGLEYGMVGINEPFLATDLAPFGGVKESGIGNEGGKYGLLEYTNIKYRLFG